MVLRIDEERFQNSFETYSAIGATENDGLHRLTLGGADHEVRDKFVEDLEALGLEVWVDEVGNVFGRREGNDPTAAPVLIGSHLDSQPYGGRYDGQLGVLCALETLRTFDDEGIDVERPVEIVNWTNEEGSRFNLAPLGSATFAGAYSVDEALAAEDKEGMTVHEALEEIGYAGDHPCEPRDLHAFLELHIEQGPRLEDTGTSIGVVEGVVGMTWLEATLSGTADHAGTTPMYDREDAMKAAANAIQRIGMIPEYLASDAVVTVGDVDVSPGSINIIPEETTFTIDLRSYADDAREEAIERIESELSTAAEREGVEATLERIHGTDHTEFSPAVQQAIVDGAEAVDASHRQLVSGAGHDAMYLSDVADTAMVFVPSVDGVSHNEDEFTRWEDCVTGANVFANATRRLATR